MTDKTKPAYLSLPKEHHFDFTHLITVLKSYQSPRDKITKMLKRGEIVRLKKGLYVLSPEYGGILNLNMTANALYGPSCVSLDSALAAYSLIPERVTVVTSVTPNRSKNFSTPVGDFSYQHVRKDAFPIGMVYVKSDKGGYFMAAKEKALCDKVMAASNIRTLPEIKAFLLDDLRMDENDLKNPDPALLSALHRGYGLKKIGLLCRWLAGLR